ncbi:MAG TPA: hypothetical protein VJB98_00395 [Candidatus Paceibacterota bacterium]
MQITNDELREFKRIYRQGFGRWISEEKARVMATKLLILCDLLYQEPVKET